MDNELLSELVKRICKLERTVDEQNAQIATLNARIRLLEQQNYVPLNDYQAVILEESSFSQSEQPQTKTEEVEVSRKISEMTTSNDILS
jgi:uncharacterized coiled-coil protein SlyX